MVLPALVFFVVLLLMGTSWEATSVDAQQMGFRGAPRLGILSSLLDDEARMETGRHHLGEHFKEHGTAMDSKTMLSNKFNDHDKELHAMLAGTPHPKEDIRKIQDMALTGKRSLSGKLYPTPKPEICESIIVNFDSAANGTMLPAGTYVQDEWLAYGLRLLAAGGLNELPRLFDTANPTGRDYDLGAPNQRCSPPGPGVGEDGEPGEPGENCNPLGNVLIVQEPNKNPDIPDDNGEGGVIMLLFPDFTASTWTRLDCWILTSRQPWWLCMKLTTVALLNLTLK